jgi:hypothetical protein
MTAIGSRTVHWEDWQDALMRKMAAEGEAASKISKALGNRTRSAVCGRCHRMGIKLLGNNGGAKSISGRRGARKAKSEGLGFFAQKREPKQKPRPKPEPPRNDSVRIEAIGAAVERINWTPLNARSAGIANAVASAVAVQIEKGDPMTKGEVPQTAKPWIYRLFGECAFPVGGGGEATLSCCKPVRRDRFGNALGEYCQDCHDRMRQPAIGRFSDKSIHRDAKWAVRIERRAA